MRAKGRLAGLPLGIGPLLLLAASGCPWFEQREPIQVLSTIPAAGTVNVPRDASVSITFDRAAAPDTLDVEMAPDVDFAVAWWDGNRRVTLEPDDPLEPATQYTVTVNDVSSAEGGWIEDSYSFSFATASEGEGEGEGEPTGDVYYVARSGDDGWAGTLANPWETVTHAAEMADAGNTVYIREGTYYDRLIPANSGTAGHYITFTSYTGETATLDGTGVEVPEDTGLVDLTGRSYICIRGLRIQNVGTTNLSAGLRAEYASHLIIEDNHTYDTASSGIGIWACSSVVVDGNEVELACNNWGMQENITVSGTDGFEIVGNHVHTGSAETIGGEGICIKDGASNGTVHDNLVHDIIDNPGIYLDAWAKHTFNIDVYNNVVHDVAAANGSGLAIASENGGLLENVRLFNNIVYNCAYNGLTFGYYGDPAASRPVHHVQVINNTFYHNGWTSWGGGVAMDNPDAQDIVFRNNILSDNNAFQLVVSVAFAEVTADHNLIDGFREFEYEVRGTDYQEGSPRFVDAARDFHVQPGSPAVDNGSATGVPADDIEGTARPQGGGYDIGAYER